MIMIKINFVLEYTLGSKIIIIFLPYIFSSSEIILGGTWMHNQDIIFDVENQRIGIVESDCGKFNADKKNNSSNSNNSQISSQQSSGLKSDSQESNSEVSSASDKTKSDSDIISENTSQSIEIKSENSSESDNSSLIQIDGYILDISKLTNKSSLKATQLYLIEKSHNSTNIESKISENSAKLLIVIFLPQIVLLIMILFLIQLIV